MAQASLNSVVNLVIDNLRVENPNPLHCQVPGQHKPQPAHLYLDENGDVFADWSTGYGMAVGQKRTLLWDVTATVEGHVLANLHEGEALPLLERVHAGHSVHWDGQNFVGELDEDAQEASGVLGGLLDDLDGNGNELRSWETQDYLFLSQNLSDHWEDQPLEEAVVQIEAEAKRGDVFLCDDVEEALLDEALHIFNEGGQALTQTHLDALVVADRITQEQADEYEIEIA